MSTWKRAAVVATAGMVWAMVAIGGKSLAGHADAIDQAKSAGDGVYSEAQAARGEEAFKSHCTNCHDTGRFTGNDFVGVWGGKALSELYDVVRTTMPEDSPGSLKPQQYADVITFFLKLNRFPAGDAELPPTVEAMKAIRVPAP
ncbi:MAG: c-type cytochrome [Acidobacteriota bacterium]